ncbi:MAG: hypothetical protein EOL88_03640 [Bacteroidia bacterium]|nr:hypothetical protein [Bacteroidia bacterium]
MAIIIWFLFENYTKIGFCLKSRTASGKRFSDYLPEVGLHIYFLYQGDYRVLMLFFYLWPAYRILFMGDKKKLVLVLPISMWIQFVLGKPKPSGHKLLLISNRVL